ncbi:MAG: hypothetical protein U9N41_06575 [Euryarchaeota archaeon]|nr:hypothetical protein [Euryarchaeota archaeon]
MPKHLTVRMAWHDNNWNGKICENPGENIYCVGNHSLLSERIARNRDLEIEKKKSDRKIDQIDDYIPPCFWSCNAFSNQNCRIKHKFPFSFSDTEIDEIEEILSPYSVFSWPFRLSFNHSKEKRAKEGNYPPDLEKRITKFINSLNSAKSWGTYNYQLQHKACFYDLTRQ